MQADLQQARDQAAADKANMLARKIRKEARHRRKLAAIAVARPARPYDEEPVSDEREHALRLESEHARWLLARGEAQPRRRGSPIDLLTDFSIDLQEQVTARLRICRALLGVGPHEPIGPKYRRGSNHPLFEPWSIDYFFRPSPPCPSCGGEGGDLLHASAGNTAFQVCPACDAYWTIGDYDWSEAADCRRFLADRDADLVYRPEEELCGTCGDPQHDHCPAIGVVVCSRSDCPFAYMMAELTADD